MSELVRKAPAKHPLKHPAKTAAKPPLKPVAKLPAKTAVAVPPPALATPEPVASPAAAPESGEETALDLGALGGPGANDFTPYVFDRGPAWGLLPLLTLAVVFLHLKKNRRKPRASS